MEKALVSLSGGLDSTTVLAHAIQSGFHCTGVIFHYGSKHNPHELHSARRVADHYKIDLLPYVELAPAFTNIQSNLLRKGGEIPHGHYEAETMRQTVVPGRNLIFLAVLAGIAESKGIGKVMLGIHQGDHFIYPDCRPEFFYAAERAIKESTEGKVLLYAPFMYHNKAEIVGFGVEMKVPYHLTRTCYKSGQVACGKCGSCQERLEAFRINGLADPLEYESRELIPKQQATSPAT